MNVALTVTALKMGVLLLEKAFDGIQKRTPIRQPVWAAAISGGERKILVDTGLHDSQWISQNCVPCEIGPEETMEASLARIGWRLEDVEIVVNTHLHYDHVGNNPRFPGALFYTGYQEWETAFHPPASQAFLYENTRQLYDQRGVRPDHWILVSQELELIPGVRLLPTPGLTEGHLSVLVETAEGVVCIAGDAVMFMENLEAGYVNLLHTDRDACLRSYHLIQARADRVFPGHSERIFPFQTRGFPLIPNHKKGG